MCAAMFLQMSEGQMLSVLDVHAAAGIPCLPCTQQAASASTGACSAGWLDLCRTLRRPHTIAGQGTIGDEILRQV